MLEGTDTCFAPVLTSAEAVEHPHHTARGTFLVDDDVYQAAPGPRFERTPAGTPRPPARVGEHTDEVLREAGLSEAEIDDLVAGGAVLRVV